MKNQSGDNFKLEIQQWKELLSSRQKHVPPLKKYFLK